MNLTEVEQSIIVNQNNKKYEETLKIIDTLNKDDKCKLKNLIDNVYINISRYIQELNINDNVNEVQKLYFEVKKYIPKEKIKITNILLNEYEIATRKTKLDSFPRLMELFLTSSCNLKCIMCGGEKNRYSLSDREFEELIGLLPYLQHLSVRGGEVFFDDRMGTLLSKANQNNVKLEVITNGLLLNEKIIDSLIDNNANLAISIDSVNKEVYESIRIGAKFENLIHNLNLLNKIRMEKKVKISTTLHMVVMKRNYNEIENIITFANKYQFDHLTIIPVSGNRAVSENFFDCDIDNKIINELSDKRELFEKLAKKYGIILHSRLPQKYYNSDIMKKDNKSLINKISDDGIYCFLPFKRMFIEQTRYKPRYLCMDLDNIEEELNDSIVKKWNSSKMIMYRQNMISKKYDNICNIECFSNKYINSNRKTVI